MNGRWQQASKANKVAIVIGAIFVVVAAKAGDRSGLGGLRWLVAAVLLRAVDLAMEMYKGSAVMCILGGIGASPAPIPINSNNCAVAPTLPRRHLYYGGLL